MTLACSSTGARIERCTFLQFWRVGASHPPVQPWGGEVAARVHILPVSVTRILRLYKNQIKKPYSVSRGRGQGETVGRQDTSHWLTEGGNVLSCMPIAIIFNIQTARVAPYPGRGADINRCNMDGQPMPRTLRLTLGRP